ncbi:RcnB family protein [Novosphingobium sp. BW1]|uniref:RcnB family protein n=1 Tax=Novosphingobium sp. BW1 TaxID=2592621 RepID=UPI0011DE69AF|nr:RcnB family protein [Novosphingobium sp. BW1]TYC91871.1 RcnB family protein [Novosphingobium sp. BW1]
MNKLVATLLGVALSFPLATAPAIAAPGHESTRSVEMPGKAKYMKKAGAKNAPAKSYTTFRKGDRFEQARARNYQSVDYRRFRKLPAPKRGYRYVRAGNDVLLIGTSSHKVFRVYGGLYR